MAIKTIAAGQLKETVILREPVSIRNSEGGKETTYTDAITCRAKVEQTNAQRALEVAPVLLNTLSVWIRKSTARTAVSTDWLVKYNGVDHVIHSIETDNEFIKLIIKAKNG
jgi:SPP1 family predicted phage head-tail adaptor